MFGPRYCACVLIPVPLACPERTHHAEDFRKSATASAIADLPQQPHLIFLKPLFRDSLDLPQAFCHTPGNDSYVVGRGFDCEEDRRDRSAVDIREFGVDLLGVGKSRGVDHTQLIVSRRAGEKERVVGREDPGDRGQGIARERDVGQSSQRIRLGRGLVDGGAAPRLRRAVLVALLGIGDKGLRVNS